MTETEPDHKTSKDRSPSYPFINLQTAVERLVAFETTFKRHPAPANKAGIAWNMKEGSSQAAQTLATLKYFGLIDYQGGGADRQAFITEEGRTYLRAQQETVKREVLRRAALKPKSIANYWHLWGADRPPDAVCLDQLVLKGGFTQSAAETFLRVFDATISYAGLNESPTGSLVTETEVNIQQGTELAPGSVATADPPLVPTLARSMSVAPGDIKVMLDGQRLHVAADVDLKGAKRLIKALQANIVLLEDDEDE